MIHDRPERRAPPDPLLGPRLLPRDERRFQWRLTLAATLLLVAVLFVIGSCGGGGGSESPVDPPPIDPVVCGPGLAAVDLAGVCRANPPTSGALEAVN
ncbi:MAG: hypothetical protein NUV51_01240 [Sulfuricaulis sp.]|nr:hypothetical protein [Sulfuricaulis sp.]